LVGPICFVILLDAHSMNLHFLFSPGRFFTEMELKAILCYLLLNYDLKTEDGSRPPNEDRGVGALPNPNARVLIRRKKGLQG